MKENEYNTGDRVTILPAFQDDGDEGTIWTVVGPDEGKGRVDIAPDGFEDWKIAPQTRVETRMIKRV